MHSKYLRIINAFFGAMWAIMPEKLEAMASFLRFAAQGGKYSTEEVAERIGPKAANGTSNGNQAQTIAVIPIQGIIDQKAARVDDISGPGGTSTERTAARFRAALADETVKAIVFDIDSPGGTVYGVDELATEIFKSRGKKLIVAMVNSLCASAAYYLAASADEIVITPGGEVGSIGVYTQHVDISKWLEMNGQKVTLIAAGDFKVEGNPYEPITDEATAYIQSRVDDYYGMFVRSVARGRGVAVSKVKTDFGKGRVMGADDALKAGLVDKVATFEQTIARLSSKRGTQAEEMAPEIQADKFKTPTEIRQSETLGPIEDLGAAEEVPIAAKEETAKLAARAAERRRLELL